MSAAAAYILPFWGSWLYCLASYIDYKRRPDAYHTYPGGLWKKLDGVAAVVLGWLPLTLWCVTTVRPTEVWMDSAGRELALLLLNWIAGDIWFYSFHRLLHWKPLYWLHRKHHEAVNPVGVLALYAHPFDAIVVNLGSVIALHLWLRFSAFQIFAVGGVAVINTILLSHSATYEGDHLLHHRHLNCNYGVGLFMDRLFGTRRHR